MPSPKPGPCTILAIDPGETTGIAVLSLNPRWLRGVGAPTWEGLGSAVISRYAVQVGRDPKTFDTGIGKTAKSTNELLEAHHLPVMGSQPLEDEPDFDARFFAILRDEWAASGGDLTMLDANEIRQLRQIQGLLEIYPKAALVVESFQLRQMSQDPVLLSPERMRFAITSNEVLHGSVGRLPVLQSSSYAMTTATDERLNRARLYMPGMKHATDAMRHATTFARDCRKDEATRARAFPRHFKVKESS